MNNHIFNTLANNLLLTPYGKSNNITTPFITDSSGRLILSDTLNFDINSNNLNIRPLSKDLDSVSINASNLDIRNLDESKDSLGIYSQSFAQGVESGTIVAFGVKNFLTRDISPYKKNVFYVKNTSGLSVSVTISLQIAPIDNDSYYINDGSSFNLIGGSTAIFSPTRLMKFARIRVSTVLLANITVYYFGQT